MGMFGEILKGLPRIHASGGKPVKPEGDEFEDSSRHQVRRGDQVGETLLEHDGDGSDKPRGWRNQPPKTHTEDSER